MKRFVLYLKETLPFWIIILISTLGFNTAFTGFNAASFAREGLVARATTLPAEELGPYLYDCNVFAVISNIFSFSDFYLYGTLFVIEMAVVFAIFKFMYKATGTKNTFASMPFKQGDTDIFTYITSVAIIIVNVFVAACVGIGTFLSKFGELLDYCTAQSLIKNERGAISFYTMYHLRESLALYFLLLTYILVLFTVFYIIKMLFKQEIVGIIAAALLISDTIVNYMYSFINPNDESWMIDEKAKILLLVLVAGIGILILLRRNIDYSKHKFMNYPYAIYGIGAYLIISKTAHLITSQTYIFMDIDFYILIAIVIAVAVYAVFKIKSSKAVASGAVGNVKFSRNSIVKDIWTKYLVIIAIVAIFVIGIFDVFDIFSYVSYIKDALNFNISAFTVEDFNANCSFVIAQSFQNMNAKLLIVFALIKLVTFLTSSHGLIEKNETLPIKKRTLFTYRYLADLTYMALPILVTSLLNYIKINTIASLYPVDVSASLSTYNLMIIYLGIYYFTFNAVIVSFVNFADVSISAVPLKIIFAGLEIFSYTLLDTAIQLTFDTDKFLDNFYTSSGAQSLVKSIPTSFLIYISIAVLLFVLSFIVCKTPLSGGMFRYKQARYVTIFLLLFIIAFVIFLSSTAVWQYVLGGVIIIALAVLLLQNKKPILR